MFVRVLWCDVAVCCDAVCCGVLRVVWCDCGCCGCCALCVVLCGGVVVWCAQFVVVVTGDPKESNEGGDEFRGLVPYHLFGEDGELPSYKIGEIGNIE